MLNRPRGRGNVFRDIEGNTGIVQFLDYKPEIGRRGVVGGLYIGVVLWFLYSKNVEFLNPGIG
jgi:hypothetical protein